MAKLSSSMADKLKNMARNLKEDEPATGLKGIADKIKRQSQSQSNKKQISSDGKASGRKD